MKNLILSLGLMFVTIFIYGQKSQKSCCESEVPLAFSGFANDQQFVGSHELPGNYKHDGHGAMVSYKTPDGKMANAFVLKRSSSNNWLIVVHEWWGLNEYIKKEAERLYGSLLNVNVIALDLYDGKVAKTREDASKFMKSVAEERAESIIKGAFSYIGEDAKIASIGWCFGGGWSLQTGVLAGDRGVGNVIFYGMPTTELNELKKLNGPVLGIFADADKWITPEVVKQFEENMGKAEKKLSVHSFKADHAFANPSSPRYNDEAAQKANAVTLKFLIDLY